MAHNIGWLLKDDTGYGGKARVLFCSVFMSTSVNACKAVKSGISLFQRWIFIQPFSWTAWHLKLGSQGPAWISSSSFPQCSASLMGTALLKSPFYLGHVSTVDHLSSADRVLVFISAIVQESAELCGTLQTSILVNHTDKSQQQMWCIIIKLNAWKGSLPLKGIQKVLLGKQGQHEWCLLSQQGRKSIFFVGRRASVIQAL